MTPTETEPRRGRFAPDSSLRRMTARGTIINGAFIAVVQLLGMSRGFSWPAS